MRRLANMVTDDERRRVAAALREYASFDCEDEGEEECLVDCTDWGERVLNLLGCGDTEGECYAALADLIEPEPERTCQDVEGGNFFRCSKCGCELMRFADGWKPLYMGEVRYCPNCGARVVEEEK
jgi:hypothetical protein